MKKIFVGMVATLLLLGAGCAPQSSVEEVKDGGANLETKVEVVEETNDAIAFPGKLSDEEINSKLIRISTEKGDIVFETFAETAPLTVSNFVYLAGLDYFDGVTFHRREEGFVIQGGDPNGNGTGGPGYEFEDELKDNYTYERGIVAMANRGPNTNGSQFFIMLGDVSLPKAYTIFGRVTEGMDVVDSIVVGDVMNIVTVEDVLE